MTIQWFPGHMTRARRQIQDKLKLIDLAIELLDARIPLSSRNPMIDEILMNKPRLVLLNKSDLADPEITRQWVAYFAEQGLKALPIDAAQGNPSKEILNRSRELLSDKIEAQLRKGIKPRAIRALIVGIPNVGKSTLINKMAGRKIAATGDRPGVTKGQQWIKVGTEMELLDTPGILWPKFEDQRVGMRLAATGAIKEEILHPEEIALFAMRYIAKKYGDSLKERFGIAEVPQDTEDNEKVVQLIEDIGRKRGALMSGGRVDLEKASLTILRELRAGKLGRVSLEDPAMLAAEAEEVVPQG
jgi:ribosome biogenesis GTPase A